MWRFVVLIALRLSNVAGTSFTTTFVPTISQLQLNASFLPITHAVDYGLNWAASNVATPPQSSLLGPVDNQAKAGAVFGLATGSRNSQYQSQPQQPFQIVYEWKYLDFEYPTYVERQRAISNGDFVIENNLPLGIDVYGDRLFVTTPRWKNGVPASFGYLPYPPIELSPAIKPYPNWDAHGFVDDRLDCSKLISVYRTSIDACGRLWLIDSGVVNATIRLNQICPPKIVAYDLATNEQLLSYQFPEDQVKQDSLHSNILADVVDGKCEDVHVFVTDVWRFGLVVYSLAKNRSWRVTNYRFNPNPIASDFNVYGLNFQWLDGVFGLSVSPVQQRTQHTYDDHILYFHPMASFTEFAVSTALLRNEEIWSSGQDVAQYFQPIGDRGANGQSSSAGITRKGIMFYTQVHRDTVSCWDTSKPYVRANLADIVPVKSADFGNNQSYHPTNNNVITSGIQAAPLIQFPNDLTVDQEPIQGVWVMSNRLPIYLYDRLDYSQINFRILRADAEHAIEGTICDPSNRGAHSTKIATVKLFEGQCF